LSPDEETTQAATAGSIVIWPRQHTNNHRR
jgi:hypothetical protein